MDTDNKFTLRRANDSSGAMKCIIRKYDAMLTEMYKDIRAQALQQLIKEKYNEHTIQTQ